jgi:hypothetical protein
MHLLFTGRIEKERLTPEDKKSVNHCHIHNLTYDLRFSECPFCKIEREKKK